MPAKAAKAKRATSSSRGSGRGRGRGSGSGRDVGSKKSPLSGQSAKRCRLLLLTSLSAVPSPCLTADVATRRCRYLRRQRRRQRRCHWERFACGWSSVFGRNRMAEAAGHMFYVFCRLVRRLPPLLLLLYNKFDFGSCEQRILSLSLSFCCFCSCSCFA